MLFVTQNKRAERLEVCKACEHYNASTRSCGTLLKRKKVKGGTLCGCFMPAKASLKTEACPLKKWPALISPQEILEIKEFLGPLENYLSREQNARLTALYNRTFHTNEGVTNCSTCIQKMIQTLKSVIDADAETYVQRETERVHGALHAGSHDAQ